jgi:hypothetical protein
MIAASWWQPNVRSQLMAAKWYWPIYCSKMIPSNLWQPNDRGQFLQPCDSGQLMAAKWYQSLCSSHLIAAKRGKATNFYHQNMNNNNFFLTPIYT